MNKKKIAHLLCATYVGGLSTLSLASIQKPVTIKQEEKIIDKKLYAFIGDKYIANVIAQSKYPYTLAAIAKVESNFRPRIIGDKGKSFGLYQIQSRYHGAFPETVEGQTKYCEQILEKLFRQYPYEQAIERYNGKGHKARQYRQKVMVAMNEIRSIQ